VTKQQTRSVSSLLWNYLLILKILPVSRFKDPKAAILTLKILKGIHLRFCKTIPNTASNGLINAHFPCSQLEVGISEHRPITWKGILRRVSKSMSKFAFSKKGNKRLIIVFRVVENFWKTLKTISACTESADWNVCNLTVPLKSNTHGEKLCDLSGIHLSGMKSHYCCYTWTRVTCNQIK